MSKLKTLTKQLARLKAKFPDAHVSVRLDADHFTSGNQRVQYCYYVSTQNPSWSYFPTEKEMIDAVTKLVSSSPTTSGLPDQSQQEPTDKVST